MIIACEKCGSKFDLDEGLVKEGGSKVRCSVCKNVFTVFPSEEGPIPDETLEETVALDSPPEEGAAPEEEGEDAFDKAFEQALEEGLQADSQEEPAEEAEEEAEPVDLEEEELIEEVQETAPKGPRTRGPRLLTIILLIILILVLGAITIFFLYPDRVTDSVPFLKPEKEQEVIDTGTRRLSLKDVSGSFLHSNRLGQLFVIKGTVVNNGPKGRSFILLKGTILDDQGKDIRRKLVYAGNTYSEDELKEMSLEEIDRGLKKQTGKGNINVDVGPGVSVPFMIVFENLPDNLGEFMVEAVSSSPGK